MAVKFALFSFFPNTCNSVTGVPCNNSSVVTYLNRMGGLGSEALNAITKQSWHWCIDRGNWEIVNFARIASICVGFHLGTLHGYFFH